MIAVGARAEAHVLRDAPEPRQQKSPASRAFL